MRFLTLARHGLASHDHTGYVKNSKPSNKAKSMFFLIVSACWMKDVEYTAPRKGVC